MGFIAMTAMLAILAGIYPILVPPPGSGRSASPWVFLVLYSVTFFFANFGVSFEGAGGAGDTHFPTRPPFFLTSQPRTLSFSLHPSQPNATTFVVPSEVFHTRYRSTLHGVSAAMGKLGAIIGAFGFGEMQLTAGTRATLIGLAVVNFIGMLFTFFIPETKTMDLEPASTVSMSTFGRVVQKEPECPLGGVSNAESHDAAMYKKGRDGD